MNNNRIISSLCYFSIFFAGFILPLIVFLIVKEKDVQKHAKAALISHLLLYIPSIVGIIIFAIISASNGNATDETVAVFGFGVITLFILLGLFMLAIVIWNIYRGIKVLNTNTEEATYYGK